MPDSKQVRAGVIAAADEIAGVFLEHGRHAHRGQLVHPQQPRFRREDDGSFTQTETTYHHLVMIGRSAEHAHANFAQGENFVAEGYTRPVNYERTSEQRHHTVDPGVSELMT